MDPIGTPLALLAAAQQCIQLAGLLREKCRDYKTAEHSLREFILQLQSRAIKIETQADFLKQIWRKMQERMQILFNGLLHVVQHKLQYAIELTDAAIGVKHGEVNLQNVTTKKGPVRKLHFALSLKKNLTNAVDDLEKWHKEFDPSWFMIARLSTGEVDRTLDSTGNRDDNSAHVAILRKLRGNTKRISSARDTRRLDSKIWNSSPAQKIWGSTVARASMESGGMMMIDHFVPHERANIVRVQEDVEQLTTVLADVDPKTFGLLKCHGYTKYRNASHADRPPVFDLFFFVPPKLNNPASLRGKLTNSPATSLNVRLSLAQSLSNAVMFVHSSQFVHKNIRPETIVIFEASSSRTSSSTLHPFLFGFEMFRTAATATMMIGDSRWEKDLYRHPQRQGVQLESEYKMLHDIYSLGVILLEIGLWSNFVTYSRSSNTPSVGRVISKVSENFDQVQTRREAALPNQQFFVKLAKEQLPCTMGIKYTDVVLSCLTCLDEEDPGFGDPEQFRDEDDVVVGVEFVESVIVKLHEISF